MRLHRASRHRTAQDDGQEPRAREPRADPGPEDPRARQARLTRRRHRFVIGVLPALLALALSLWLAAVWGWTFAGHRAAIAKDSAHAVRYYRTVERLNPWFEQWRVRYNLGTAELVDDQVDAAVKDLERALKVVPRAPRKTGTTSDGTQVQVAKPDSPECLVRGNLAVAHVLLAAKAQEAGDSAAVEEQKQAAVTALDDCSMPSGQDGSDSTPDPSTSPDPSASPDPTASPDPSASPSPDPSASPNPSASPDPSASPSPGSTSTPSASASPSPTPRPGGPTLDPRLQTRNPQQPGGGGARRPW